MERAHRGLSLLFSHDHRTIIGRAENIRIDPDRVLRGTLKFREGEHWDMVREGDLRDVSIGYRVDKWEETEAGARAVAWTPVEVSMVAVPADSAAGIGRTLEDDPMPEVNAEKIRQDAIRAEQKRCNDIRHHFKHLGADQGELRDRCISEGLSFEESIRELSRVRETSGGEQTEATTKVRAQATGEDGESQRAMADWLEYRSGVHRQVKADGTRNDDFWNLHAKVSGSGFQGMRLRDMARNCLESVNVNTTGWTDDRIFDEAFTRAVDGPLAQTTANFSNLLVDQINKAVLQGWQQAPETWQRWCETGSAADFKTGSRIHVSNFTTLDMVPENTDYSDGALQDFAEPFQVKTYGKLWSISRQALINDDQSGLARAPRNMGRAAARKVGDIVYGKLTANGNMSDGNALFSSQHNNVDATAGGPDLDTIDAGRRAMALQTDNNSVTLGLVARYIVVPLELRNAARVVARSITLPADNQAFGIINPAESDNYVVIDEHRLSSHSATLWYMMGDTEQMEVVWLNGVSVPMLESQPNWKRDGLHYKVRLDFDVLPVDWRTFYRKGVPPS